MADLEEHRKEQQRREEADVDAGAPIQTYRDGFEISGANEHGACIGADEGADPTVVDYGDPVLGFK